MAIDSDRVQRLLGEALERPESERGSYLDEACGDDVALRREIDSLLEADRAAGSFLSSSPAGGDHSLIGRSVGAYRIVDVVARGGMGIVYRAEQQNPSRQVALKLMARSLLSPDMQKRFDVEVQVLGRLQHPGIAQIFEAGTADTGDGQRPFFAMEYIDGLPLTGWADRQGLGLRDRLALMIRVCEGVQHAHQKGVIHRDLKPANILVDPTGQPKVLDFGVARLTDVDLQVTTIGSERGALLGTLSYMSPEQVGGNTAELDTRSDVYSLGVVCYELLTGRLPHDLKGKSITEAIRAISEESPRTLAAAGRAVQSDVETIVAKALSSEPSRRYDSVSALADDLRRFLDNQPISARPPNPLYHLRKLVARNRLASGLAVALILLLIGFSAVMVAQTRRIAAERDRASNEAATSRQVTEFLQEIFTDPSPAKARGNELTAREILDRGAQKIKNDLEDQPLVQARLMVIMGGVYLRLGLHDPARQLLESGIEVSRGVLDQEPHLTVEGLRALAWLYRDEGKYEEGSAVALDALETAEAVLEPDDLLLGDTLLTRGVLLRDSGDTEEARRILEDTLEWATRVRGIDSETYGRALYHLGWLEHQSGKDEEASKLYDRGCSILEQVLATDHPDIAYCYHDHSIALTGLKDYRASQARLAQAIAIWERVLPPGHPNLASAIDNRGTQLFFAGDNENAAIQYRRALAMREERLGSEHVEVGSSWMNIALAEKAMGKWKESEQHFLRALEIQQSAVGPDHRLVNNTLLNLAELYTDRGRLEEALGLHERIVAARERMLGADHPRMAGALKKQGDILGFLGRYEEAESVLRRSLGIVSATAGPAHPYRVSLVVLLGESIRRQGRTSEAETLYEETRAALEEAGENGEPLAQVTFALARSARSKGENARAEALLDSTIELRRDLQAEDHPALLYTQAVAFAHRGEKSEALEALRRSLDGGLPVRMVDTETDFTTLGREEAFQSLMAEHAPTF